MGPAPATRDAFTPRGGSWNDQGRLKASLARHAGGVYDVGPREEDGTRAVTMEDRLVDGHAVDPSALARFGRLELVARLVVEGVMAGMHRSPFKGFSVEFAEHRQYGPGDEIRHIDWRAFGKSDRYYVKEYEEETNLKAYLVVDSSGSMGYSGRTGAKLEHARRLAAALAYLMIGQRDAVGLVTADGEARGLVPPRSSPGHLSVLCKVLEETEAGGEAPLSGLLHALADRARPTRAGRRALGRIRAAGRAHGRAPAPEAPPPRGALPARAGPRGGGVPLRAPDAVPRPRSPRPEPPRRSRDVPRGLPRAVPGLLPGLAREPGRHGGRLPQGLDRRGAERTLLDYLASRSRGKARRGEDA